jgi:hypothetical protein
MAAPCFFNKYYFDLSDWINVIHDLERYPDLPPVSDPSLASTVTEADLRRWKQLFGLNAADTTYSICEWRSGKDKGLPTSEKILEKWP